MEIRQGDEIFVKAEVTGTLTGYKSEDRYRVRIGDQVIWITPKDIKEDA